jgi:hypothetical protein
MFPRGANMLDAMIRSAPIEVKVRKTYKGDCELLMVYGMGHPVRQPWQRQHVKAGGRLIGWDLGYWHRDGKNPHMRCTIDHEHPQRMLRPEPPDRWAAAGIALREDARAKGPIMVVGMGPKSLIAHGLRLLAWESDAVALARAAFPGKAVVYRPKRMQDALMPGEKCIHGPIETALRGMSLVICRHSNVAVDACIAGVPVVCEDGAASALYGADISNPRNVTREERLAFLQNLAYWNWKPTEAEQAWTYLLDRLAYG